MGCPRTFPRSKHLNISYETAFGAYAAKQEIDVATQHNICAANQDTAEHSTTSVQPIRSEKIKQSKTKYNLLYARGHSAQPDMFWRTQHNKSDLKSIRVMHLCLWGV